ncbi:MAG: triose-phosphate isomerase [SAR86 cluster bacterium]
MFIANWKMNGSQSMLVRWLEGINKTLDESLQTKCILCPPVCFLSEASKIIKREKLSISLGAQNIDPSNISPLTGGIDGAMLKELGAEYVVIGHSERRKVFKEDNQLLLEKLESASKEDLRVIFCIGESLKEKEEGKTISVLREQLEILNEAELNKFIVAYEPVWAIGSGETAKLDDIEDIHRQIVNEVRSSEKESFLGVFYGGSVDSSSSRQILSLKGVQGLLIGGASLECEEFCNIVLTNNRN